MRAATVIVGAIAVSSCLIALALIISAGGDSGDQVVADPGQGKGSPQRTQAGEREETAPTVSTPTQCNVEVTVEGASCFLGKSVLAAYKDGSRGQITAVDSESGEEITLACDGTAPVICSSESGATVYLAP